MEYTRTTRVGGICQIDGGGEGAKKGAVGIFLLILLHTVKHKRSTDTKESSLSHTSN